MPRNPRAPADDCVYHVINRGNCRMKIFTKPADFAAFVKLLEEGRKRFGMRILGYILMGNHFHLILWPRRGKDLSLFMGWVCTTHVRRWRAHRGSEGEGHLYQGRYKSFLCQEEDRALLVLMRYVEANALRAGLVKRAEDWLWSSLVNTAGAGGVRVVLTDWPVERPHDWLKLVNEPIDEKALAEVRTSIKRGKPFGEPGWVERMVKRYGLQSTVRDPWRPRKKQRKTPNKTRA